MLKGILSPVQKWFLQRGQCVGCGMPLKKALMKKHSRGELAICKCGRGYFHETNGGWRRAVESELKN